MGAKTAVLQHSNVSRGCCLQLIAALELSRSKKGARRVGDWSHKAGAVQLLAPQQLRIYLHPQEEQQVDMTRSSRRVLFSHLQSKNSRL